MSAPFENLRKLGYAPFLANDHVDPSAFDGLAAAVGYAIPADYLAFLQAFPGTGMFGVDDGVVVKGKECLSGRHDGWYGLDMLYAACSDKRHDLLEYAVRPEYEHDAPRYTLLIGEDSGGNVFVLDLRPESHGRVYFWDHEQPMDEPGLYHIADSFTEFANGLRDYATVEED